MGEKTGIAWCHHTFNPWIGCTAVSPGCDHCYAEALDRRHHWGVKKGTFPIGTAPHWGPGAPRRRTSESNWREPLRWNEKARAAGECRLVFCASLADVFDNEVDPTWRHALFNLIRETRSLTWLLLTKRIGNVVRMLPEEWDDGPYGNVWLGASVVNQEEADRDIPKLLATPAAKRFVSYEPALGPVDFTRLNIPSERGEGWKALYNSLRGSWINYRGDIMEGGAGDADQPPMREWGPHLDWVIVGGESAQGGAEARPFDLAWARSTVEQCRAAGVAAFVKQLGSYAVTDLAYYGASALQTKFKDRAGADLVEWPVDLRVQEFPT